MGQGVRVAIVSRFLSSYHLFLSDEKEVSSVLMSALFFIYSHGTEEESDYHRGHKSTQENAENSCYSLVISVLLGVEMFNRMGRGRSGGAESENRASKQK